MALLSLAQSGDASSRAFVTILPWVGALLVLALVGGVLILLARKMFRNNAESTPAGFTLHELRQLHAAGELSDEEFHRARDAMIGQVRSSVLPADATEADDENSDPTQ